MSERPTPEEPQVRPRGTPGPSEPPQRYPRGTPEVAVGQCVRGHAGRCRHRGRRRGCSPAARTSRRRRPLEADELIDLGGAPSPPGLVNTHHHLYQTPHARAGAAGGPVRLAARALPDLGTDRRRSRVRSRPHRARRARALRLHDRLRPPLRLPPGRPGFSRPRCRRRRSWSASRRPRGSMDLGESDGGLPPDEIVERTDDALAETERAAALHDPDPGARIQITVAPCSPFSVTRKLMEESGSARAPPRSPAHTHLAETLEEEQYCKEPRLHAGRVPREPRLAGRRRGAHCVHLSDDEIGRFAASGTGVAHCPTSNLRLGAGVARVELVDAGVPVGLGVDGSASNERSDLGFEVKQALLVARGRGGPEALTAREALHRGGARGARARRHRLIEPGKQADLAVWRTDGLEPRRGRATLSPACALGPTPRRPALRRRRGDRLGRPPRPRRRRRDRPRPSCPGEKIHGVTSLSTRPRHRRWPAGARRARRALAAETTRCRRRRTRTAGSRTSTMSSPQGRIASSFHPPSPFFRRVELEVELDADAHYHVPLLVFALPCRATAAVDRRRALLELFSGRTRLVERLAAADDPLGRAAEIALAAPEDEQAEAPLPIPASASLGRTARRRARGARRARKAELRVRGSLRLSFRRVRRPASTQRLIPVLRERLGRTREQELQTGSRTSSRSRDRWQQQ